MANQTFYSGLLTDEQMNSGASYRVQFSYGVFSIYAKKVTQQVYYYAHRRKRGKLYKVYVGKCGSVTKDLLHQATMRLLSRIEADDARERKRFNPKWALS